MSVFGEAAVRKSVAEIMSQPVVEIDPETRVGKVMQLAEELGVHHFPIVKGGALQGLVCTCDLSRARPETGVLQLAHRHVSTIDSTRPAREAAELMRTASVGSLVVTRGGAVCGMLTRHDLVKQSPELAELLETQRCSVCKKQYHLRQTSSGACLCASCEERAQERHWLGVGASD